MQMRKDLDLFPGSGYLPGGSGSDPTVTTVVLNVREYETIQREVAFKDVEKMVA
jgi:hypothetical protein